jgi:DNA repair exonuclease SbcCD ATPase subunit
MLEKEDLKQIENIVSNALGLNNNRLETIFDSKLSEALQPIKQELADIRVELKEINKRLDRLEKAESEDISAAYRDIEVMKQQLADLEIKVRKLQEA